MSITNLLRLVFNLWKILDFIHYFWLCLHKVLTFHHFGILKNSTIDLPISILLGGLHPEFNRALMHNFFGFVYINSKICSHIWKLKNKVITKLFHKAFRKCIQQDTVWLVPQKESKFKKVEKTRNSAKFQQNPKTLEKSLP